MVIAQLHLPVKLGKKCAGMYFQIGEQSSQKPKWKLRKAGSLKFTGNVDFAWQLVKNASGRRAAEVFMETTEEHKVLRPNSACKNARKWHSHGKRSIAWENWSFRASWCGGHVPKFAMRQQRKDVSPQYTEAQRELRCYISGVSQRRIEREFQQLSGAHCTI